MTGVSWPNGPATRMTVPESVKALGLPEHLWHTRYARLLADGAPTVTIYYVMPSGRVRDCVGIEDPEAPGTYLTEKQNYNGYPLGCWLGQLTPGAAVSDWIGRTSIMIGTTKRRLERLERALARYEAAQAKLVAGG